VTRRIEVITFACPNCGQRIQMRIPVTSAICHNKHRATVMRPVNDATSKAS
jgi:hypothetical protein